MTDNNDTTKGTIPLQETSTFAKVNEQLRLQIENEKLTQQLEQLKLENSSRKEAKSDWSKEAKGYSNFSEVRKIVSLSFSGESDNLQAFVEQCNLAYNVCHDDLKPSLLVHITNKVEGNARVDIRDECFEDWPELRTFLKGRFQDAKTEDQLMNDLFSLQQFPRESVTEFFRRIERLKLRIVEASGVSGPNKIYLDKIALNHFRNKCIPQISHLLTIQTHNTPAEALAAAVQIEKFENQCTRNSHNSSSNSAYSNYPKKQNSSQNSSKFCSFHKSSGHDTSECRANRTKSHEAQVNVINCNYCKRDGHIIKDCRKLKWKQAQEAKEDNQNTSTEPTSRSGDTTQILSCDPNVYITVKSENAKKGYLFLIVDSGAQMSILKKSSLTNLTMYLKEKIEITGITSGQKYSSEGYVFPRIQLQKFKYEFKFHVVKPEYVNLNVDGIIGHNILQDAKCIIDYKNQCLFFDRYQDSTPFAKMIETRIPGRTILPVTISTTFSEDIIVKPQGLPKTIEATPTICKPENNQIRILLSNHSKKKKKITFFPEITNFEKKILLPVQIEMNEEGKRSY